MEFRHKMLDGIWVGGGEISADKLCLENFDFPGRSIILAFSPLNSILFTSKFLHNYKSLILQMTMTPEILQCFPGIK